MSGSVNKVILIGRLGKDPEIKYTPGGAPVAKFSLATDESYKDKSGETQKRVEWHNIVAWNRLAEICGEYLTKGKQVYIEGRIQSRQWQDQSGNKRTAYDIVAREMKMLGSKAETERYAAASGERATPDRPASAAPASASEPPPDEESADDVHSPRGDASGHTPQSPPESEITDEDIPF
jgi:single-strand DNA-binding protein